MPVRLPFRLPILPIAAVLVAIPFEVQAQNYADLPPLTPPSLEPMSEAEIESLPPEYRSAPLSIATGETVTTENGVETITRTRRIDRQAPAAPVAAQGYNYGYAAPGYAPAVFERQQWIDECRRRTQGRRRDETGLIIGGLLGAVAGGFIGSEIAAVGDKTLGAVLGVGGGGLVGGLIGSLFDGDKKKNLYDCEAALDSYLTQYGAPTTRVASREIAYPAYAPPAYGYGYAYPQAYSYGYAYAPPQQVVLVPVRSEVQQQVVVRETERYETYTVPGAARVIPAPAPRPSPKMIKQQR
jgi:hypothetical protein